MNLNLISLAILITLSVVTISCKETDTVYPDISIPETVAMQEGNDQQVKALIPVTLSAASDQQVSLLWSTSDGTAKAGEDYIAVTDSVLVFQPGETIKNIEVRVINDLLYESDKNFYVTVSDEKNGNIIQNLAKITITNDDVFVPVVGVAVNTKANEGSTTQSIAKVTVALTDVYDQEISLKWSTTDGTAKSGEDYVPVTGSTIVFAPGEKTKYIEVQLVNDAILEFNENFFVNIDEVTNAQKGVSQSKVTIADDDTYIPEIAADGPITPDTYPGMQLVWSDEFDGSTLNMNWWSYETGGGGWGNNELQTYTNLPANSFLESGKLNIVAVKNNGNYTSARLVTKGKKEFTYGRIDIRAKMPVGKGIWPALWTLGANNNQVGWPACGEIDIMEYLGHDVSKTYGTAHYNDGGHQYRGGSYTLPGGQGFNEQFHVFTIVWQEGSIVWYVDYKKFYDVTNATVKFDAFNLAQFFIFNVAVGGNWPGNPDATTVFPQTMQVDYIRLFMPQ